MIKKCSRSLLLLIGFLTVGSQLEAQEAASLQTGKYNSQEAFSPLFYTSNGNEYRSASGYPGPKYWQNRADYNISANLDDQTHTVTGTVTITYKNNSPDQLPFLWLQLDQNLFAKASRGNALITKGSRYGARGEQIDGGYKLTNISVLQKSKAVKFNSLIEDTRMQIQLDQPLAANGELITIKMDFSFPIPINGSDRMGHLSTKNGEIYSIAQWFPRMSVYDDIHGWNTMPYWGAGEFYLEYGDINYSVTAAANQVVLGSGELLNPQEVFTAEELKRWNAARNSDKTVVIRSEADVLNPASRPSKPKITWKYKMNNTRDVAWASSKAFIVSGARINLPSGNKAFAVDAHPAESNTPNGYVRGAEFVKSSIEHYSKQWFEYPYPMAINIASNISGMEYPGIVFCGYEATGEEAWGVIDHEFGHTWFPMIVGSNERKFGWMDEGFNTFINNISKTVFNNGEFNKGRMDYQATAKYLARPSNERIMLEPDAMREANIGVNLYFKPAIGLEMLRKHILGEARFDYAFRNYIKHWAYKHPTPTDFFRSMENAAGEDLSWFWKGWFMEDWNMDQAVTSVKEAKSQAGAREGYDILISNLDRLPMPIILGVETASGKKDMVRIPVDVWMRNSTWTVHYPTTEEVVAVTLDPDHGLPDANAANNSWKK
jgi:hypothetical protein